MLQIYPSDLTLLLCSRVTYVTYTFGSIIMSDWINKELCLKHGKIPAMLELNSPQYKWQADCYSGNHPAGQQNKRVISISDKSLFPSTLASPAVLRSRQCWAVMSVLCLRVSRRGQPTDTEVRTAEYHSAPPAASFTCHEDEDRTGQCSVRFKRLCNSSLRFWSVLFKHLQTHSVKAFSI